MAPGSGVVTGDYGKDGEKTEVVFGEQTGVVRIITQEERPGHALMNQTRKRVETLLRETICAVCVFFIASCPAWTSHLP